jgi:subfamily B ATP-binding cassette protein MsbA
MTDWLDEPRTKRDKKDMAIKDRKPMNWQRLFGFLRPYRAHMLVAVVALAISSGLGLVFPLVIVQLLESVLGTRSFDQLNLLTLGLIGLFFFQALFSFAQSYTLSYVGEKIVADLRKSLYGHLQTLSLDFFTLRRTGEIVSRLSSDVTQVRTVLTSSLTSLLSQIVSLVGSIVIVFVMNPNLTLFILLLIPALLVIGIAFGRPLQRLSTALADDYAESLAHAEEGIQGVRIVKSFVREKFETDRYNRATDKTFRTAMRVTIYRSVFLAVMAFLGFSALGAILWFGGREVIEGRLSLPMISGFLIYGVTIAANLGGLTGFYTQLRETLGGIRRVFEILDTPPSVQDAPDAKPLGTVQGEIAFEDVSFSYDGKITVLENVNLRIAPGEIVALVGPSGSGKTTIINLIPRFYDPTAGRITIDGHDLRSVTQHSLREQIGIVPQETLLFSGTIRDNILYGRPTATPEEVIAAAKAANAHDFIMALPEGYDSKVGERGIKLSGGQRQRVAIARAILKDPRILLLDEATSALDNESEVLVQSALDRLMQGRTTLIIAHRLSTIKVAHRIVVLADGKVVEQGTHDELMARDGLYARLYNMQFKLPDDPDPVLPVVGEDPNAAKPTDKRRSTGVMGVLGGIGGRRGG